MKTISLDTFSSLKEGHYLYALIKEVQYQLTIVLYSDNYYEKNIDNCSFYYYVIDYYTIGQGDAKNNVVEDYSTAQEDKLFQGSLVHDIRGITFYELVSLQKKMKELMHLYLCTDKNHKMIPTEIVIEESTNEK